MADDILTIGGPRQVLTVSAAEMPTVEDLDGWDIGEKLVTSPARAWLVGRYLHAGMPPNSNGHVFRLEQIKQIHAMIPHTPFDMLHDPRRIVGHYAATKLVTPAALAAATSYTETPYVKAVACVYAYNFPNDLKLIQDAYEKGLAFMSMSCLPQSVTCPTCAHNAPWAGYTSSTYCEHMQGTNPKWMEHPLFVGGAAIVPPTRPGWRNAAVTRIAGFMDANEEVAAHVFERLAQLAPAASRADLEGVAAELLAVAYGPAATDVEATVKIAPLWDKLTVNHPTVDFRPTPAVQDAADPSSATTPHVAVRAHALACGDPVVPAGVRWLAAQLAGADLADADRTALGGATTLTWASEVLAAMAADTPDFSGSGMLALYPADPDALVVEGGQPASEMHVTIAYLGNTDEVTSEAFDIAGSFGLAALASRPPIEASVSGCGTLGTEGAVVLYLQGNGLTDAYEQTWAVLDASGQTYHQRHPSFIAHCTIGYAETPEETAALVTAGLKLVGSTVRLDRAGYDGPGGVTESIALEP